MAACTPIDGTGEWKETGDTFRFPCSLLLYLQEA